MCKYCASKKIGCPDMSTLILVLILIYETQSPVGDETRPPRVYCISLKRRPFIPEDSVPRLPLLAPVTGKSHSCLLPVLLSWALAVSLLSDQSRDEAESPFSSSGAQPGGKNLAVYQSILPLPSYWYGPYLGRRLPQGEGWVGGGSRLDGWWSVGDVSNGSKVSGIDNVIKGGKNKRALLCLRVERRI